MLNSKKTRFFYNNLFEIQALEAVYENVEVTLLESFSFKIVTVCFLATSEINRTIKKLLNKVYKKAVTY